MSIIEHSLQAASLADSALGDDEVISFSNPSKKYSLSDNSQYQLFSLFVILSICVSESVGSVPGYHRGSAARHRPCSGHGGRCVQTLSAIHLLILPD